eukprot:12108273-Prorocentrum_lima.AAC.1
MQKPTEKCGVWVDPEKQSKQALSPGPLARSSWVASDRSGDSVARAVAQGVSKAWKHRKGAPR